MMKESTDLKAATVVPPLRARQPNDGPVYTRPPEVEESLVELYSLDRNIVAERSTIADPDDPEYVPSECVLHFVRQKRTIHWPDAYGTLFRSLRQRILRGTRVPLSRSVGDTDQEKEAFEQDVADFVLDHFLSLMKVDAQGYDTRLDHFEVRFNQAVKADRVDAVRKTQRRPKLKSFGESSMDALHPESEGQFVAIFQNKTPNGEEITYRNEVIAAINELPDGEKQVIRLAAMEYSNVEIAKMLGCTEKTVYNRKTRAMTKLEVFWKEVGNG